MNNYTVGTFICMCEIKNKEKFYELHKNINNFKDLKD
jgi:hypothetical protein